MVAREATPFAFQSTRSVRSATSVGLRRPVEFPLISIHALRAERDSTEESKGKESKEFQSTRSVRSATARVIGRVIVQFDFNPRAPCGARRTQSRACRPARQISIHALRAERDSWNTTATQATTPISIHALRAERDRTPGGILQRMAISIHALRAERDYTAEAGRWSLEISIHALRAERDGRTALPFS